MLSGKIDRFGFYTSAIFYPSTPIHLFCLLEIDGFFRLARREEAAY